MDGSIKELAEYRYKKALEDLTASEVTLKESLYKVSINRSYYTDPIPFYIQTAGICGDPFTI